MTQVWVVKYDRGMYLFGSLELAEQSIRNIYPEPVDVEKDTISDQHHRFVIMAHGRIQDEVFATAFDVYDAPAVIHRGQDQPAKVQRPARSEF